MYWVAAARWIFLPVVLLVQAAHSLESVLLQVNAENSAENNEADNGSSQDLPPHPLPPHNVDAESGRSKPHIVLIVADDLGWHDVSWHNPKVHTPNLGNLATTGVILNQSYVMHICTPSRSALMTGRYPFTIGRQHGVIKPMEPVGLTMDATLLPQELKNLGYSTHVVGKWHLGFCNWKYTPTKRGFDTFYGYYNGAEHYFTHRRERLTMESSDGDYYANICDTHHSSDTTTTRSNLAQDHVQEILNTETESGSDSIPYSCAGRGGYDFRNITSPDFDVEGTYSTYVFASYIEDLLATRDAKDPMFLYMPFQSVHGPLEVPEKYIEPFNYVKDHNRRTIMGMLSALDEAVGRIVRALKETGHYNNSIIVFTTDNGGQTMAGGNNWPLRGRKATLWEGGTRGSAFVHSPLLNKTAGTVSNQLVHVSDWFATLLGVAGGDVPEGLDSIDQWEAITGNSAPPRNMMIYNLDDTEGIKGGIRIGDYKLLLGEQGFDKWVPPPEGLPKEINKEIQNTTEEIAEVKNNTNSHPITISELYSLILLEDITTENKLTNKLITNRTKGILNTKRNLKRKLRNKEKLKEKIRKEKIAFQNMLSIKSDDNNIDSGNSFKVSTKKSMKAKKQKSLAGHHISVGEDEQRPFVVEAVIDPQFDYTDNTNISGGNPRNMPSPMTFADLLKWTVDDLVNYKKLQIKLFNIRDDPTEHHDLANKKPSLVKNLLGQLLLELPRLVKPEVKPEDHRANPKYWDNIWSPGWC